MGFYDAMKDAVALAQKADNIELYRQLLDLSAQALDLQDEVVKLREENAELKKGKDIESRLIRHHQPFLTLSKDQLNIKYCATCWDNERKLIQMKPTSPLSTPELLCNVCRNRCKDEG